MLQQHFYVQVQLEAGSEQEQSALGVRRCVERALQTLFGTEGAARGLDVLRAGQRGAVLRVASGDYRRLRAALALHPGIRVTGAASSLLALLMTEIRRLESGGGKDVVLVAAPALLAAPSAAELPAPAGDAGGGGLLRPDGSINWGCPCLGGMAAGPCGDQFREAFSCFHYSEAEPKGSECYEKFSVMQECMARYPDLYGKDEGGAGEEEEEGEGGPPGGKGEAPRGEQPGK